MIVSLRQMIVAYFNGRRYDKVTEAQAAFAVDSSVVPEEMIGDVFWNIIFVMTPKMLMSHCCTRSNHWGCVFELIVVCHKLRI